jgi:hypothetical protein
MVWMWLLFAVWAAFRFLVTGSLVWALVLVGDLFFLAYLWWNRASAGKRTSGDSLPDGRRDAHERQDRSSWLLLAFLLIGAVVVVPPLAGLLRHLGGSGYPWLAAVPLVLLGLVVVNAILFFRSRRSLHISRSERRAAQARQTQSGEVYSKKVLFVTLAVMLVVGFAALGWIGAHQEEIAANLQEQQVR